MRWNYTIFRDELAGEIVRVSARERHALREYLEEREKMRYLCKELERGFDVDPDSFDLDLCELLLDSPSIGMSDRVRRLLQKFIEYAQQVLAADHKSAQLQSLLEGARELVEDGFRWDRPTLPWDQFMELGFYYC